MTIFGYLIITFWAVLFAVWILGALTAKRTARANRWLAWAYRVVFAIIVFLVFRMLALCRWLHEPAAVAHGHLLQTNPFWGAIGTLVALSGISLAISARLTLGRNWGMPMIERIEPELVTHGVYAYVRHPIYAGFILGMLGSALGESIIWLIPLATSVPYFLYSAKREEKLMLRIFPDRYPAYLAHTRGFLPRFRWQNG